MKRIGAGFVVLLATATVLCAQKVVIKGSNTFGEELAPRVIEEFRKAKPDIAVELESEGSGSGILALLDGTCDIASSSRAMNEDELRMARSRGIALRNHTIGYYGVAVVVHPSNPIAELTDSQVCDLFTGVLTNWRDVGGAAAPVRIVIRNPISGTYLGFQELAMERRPYATNAQMFTSYPDIAKAVRDDPQAIGYVGMTLAAHDGVKAVSINRAAPTARNVADHLYPYARQLRFYTNKKHLSPEAKAFIAFVRGKPGQGVLEELGFVRRTQLKLPVDTDTP